jgi:hypothetical protein
VRGAEEVRANDAVCRLQEQMMAIEEQTYDISLLLLQVCTTLRQ